MPGCCLRVAVTRDLPSGGSIRPGEGWRTSPGLSLSAVHAADYRGRKSFQDQARVNEVARVVIDRT
jgi:hypothetical protein